LHLINGARILVPQALTLIQPKKGKVVLIDKILLTSWALNSSPI
jgi:hypothetical protein